MSPGHAHAILKVSLFTTCCLLVVVTATCSSCHAGTGRPDAGTPGSPVPFKKFDTDIQPLVLAFHGCRSADFKREILPNG
jgi:hypothetical protein